MKIFLKNAYIFIFLTLVSCKSIGPHQIKIDRYRYNDVLLSTQKEELLSNIVRARYLEPLSFMKITNITASYTLNPSLTSNNNAILTRGAANVYNMNAAPEISYSDQPTISYMPVTASAFINEMYSPIALENLHTLMFGGTFDHRLILKLSIQYITTAGIDNASDISNAEVMFIPQYKKYHQLLNLFNQLRRERGVRIIAATIDADPTIAITFEPGFNNHPLAIQLKKLLLVPLNSQAIVLAQKPYPEKNILQIETRSVMGIINYLCHGIDLPPNEAKIQGGNFIKQDGTSFKLDELLGDLFHVYSSKSEPFNVYVKSYLHHNWFYIKESDRKSKITFNYLNTLILLTAKQLGKEENTGPLLTIPTR